MIFFCTFKNSHKFSKKLELQNIVIENPCSELAEIQAVQTLRLSEELIYQNNATVYLERMKKSISEKG